MHCTTPATTGQAWAVLRPDHTWPGLGIAWVWKVTVPACQRQLPLSGPGRLLHLPSAPSMHTHTNTGKLQAVGLCFMLLEVAAAGAATTQLINSTHMCSRQVDVAGALGLCHPPPAGYSDTYLPPAEQAHHQHSWTEMGHKGQPYTQLC